MSSLRQDQSDFNVLFIHSALDEAGLTVRAFRVYCHLARRAGKDGAAYPGAESMAAVCRMKRDTVFAALRELEGRGMLARRKRHGRPNDYWLTKASQWRQILPVPNEGTSPQTGLHPSPQTGRKGNPSEGDPSEGDPSEGLAAAKPQRVRDECFEALIELSGCKLSEVTKSMRGSVNLALKSIREVMPDLSAAEIQRRAAAYRSLYPRATLTAAALAKHWAVLGQKKEQSGGRPPSPYEVPPCGAWKDLARAIAARMNWNEDGIDDGLSWQDLDAESKLAVWGEFKQSNQAAA